MTARTILVTGATGKQGGSLINAFTKADVPIEIIGLTRNVPSVSAQALLDKHPRIKLVHGSFNNVEEIFYQAEAIASSPIWGVFSVQAVTKNEEVEGKMVIDVALKNGVKHFVYTSADRGLGSDTNATNVPHLITKYNIEQHLIAKAKGSGMTWTILRPVAFFDNLTPDFFGKVFTTSFMWKLSERQKLQMIGTSDIGYVASQAFLHADTQEFLNKSISLASEEMTFRQMKHIFAKITGEKLPMTYTIVAMLLNFISHELGSMFKWFHDVGFGADIASLRKTNTEMKDFATWLQTESAWKS